MQIGNTHIPSFLQGVGALYLLVGLFLGTVSTVVNVRLNRTYFYGTEYTIGLPALLFNLLLFVILWPVWVYDVAISYEEQDY